MKRGVIDAYSKITPEDADYINNNYDMFIIPLANAFRESFKKELETLTKLIDLLYIPCVVVGVGLQASYEPNLDKNNSFDEAAYNFYKAVLKKSASIGVRGEITATYLKRLGIPSSNIRIIGCPSMYLYGEFLPLKMPKKLTLDSKVALNYHGNFNNLHEFIYRTKKQFKNYYIVTQGIKELCLLYAGDEIPTTYCNNNYFVNSINCKTYKDNRITQFINVPSWINFLETMDVGMGSCIHGCIASVLSGNPTILIAADSRTRELAMHHNITMYNINDINKQTSLFDLYNAADFSKVLLYHKRNYEEYLSFMRDNEINCSYIKRDSVVDFDITTQRDNINKGIQTVTSLPFDEQYKQMASYIKLCEGKIRWWKNQTNDDELPLGGIYWVKSKECVERNMKYLIR